MDTEKSETALQNADRLQLSMNYWPLNENNNDAQDEFGICFGGLYTPLKEGFHPRLHCYPAKCRFCKVLINMFCKIKSATKTWICNFCNNENQFSDFDKKNSVVGINSSTVEYVQHVQGLPIAFVFVIDLLIETEELISVKNLIKNALLDIPDDALVGIITFNDEIILHRLDGKNCVTVVSVSGTELFNPETLKKNIYMNPSDNEFLRPLKEYRQTIIKVIDQMEIEHCAERCTGNAIVTALHLLSLSNKTCVSRTMVFVRGPCTSGPGKTVEFKNCESQQQEYLDESKMFYEHLSNLAVLGKITVDIFSCSVVKNNIKAMASMCNLTGGRLIVKDSFQSSDFIEEFQQIFTKDLQNHVKMNFDATLVIKAAAPLKITAVLGPCMTLEKNSEPNHTLYKCKLSSLEASTTIAIFFDRIGELKRDSDNPTSKVNKGYLQCVLEYQHSSGAIKTIVTTVERVWAEKGRLLDEIITGFDPKVAVVLLSRIAAFKTEENKSVTEIINWIDKMLIRFSTVFAEFSPDNPKSLKLEENRMLYLNYLYYLRRSSLIHDQYSDGSVFYRHMFFRENLCNSLKMLKPHTKEAAFLSKLFNYNQDLSSARLSLPINSGYEDFQTRLAALVISTTKLEL